MKMPEKPAPFDHIARDPDESWYDRVTYQIVARPDRRELHIRDRDTGTFARYTGHTLTSVYTNTPPIAHE